MEEVEDTAFLWTPQWFQCAVRAGSQWGTSSNWVMATQSTRGFNDSVDSGAQGQSVGERGKVLRQENWRNSSSHHFFLSFLLFFCYSILVLHPTALTNTTTDPNPRDSDFTGLFFETKTKQQQKLLPGACRLSTQPLPALKGREVGLWVIIKSRGCKLFRLRVRQYFRLWGPETLLQRESHCRQFWNMDGVAVKHYVQKQAVHWILPKVVSFAHSWSEGKGFEICILSPPISNYAIDRDILIKQKVITYMDSNISWCDFYFPALVLTKMI